MSATNCASAQTVSTMVRPKSHHAATLTAPVEMSTTMAFLRFSMMMGTSPAGALRQELRQKAVRGAALRVVGNARVFGQRSQISRRSTYTIRGCANHGFAPRGCIGMPFSRRA
jgi:hypothetical protein